jgi:hypothetical protein
LRAPATKNSSSRGQSDNRPEKRGRSASRREAKRSAFVVPAHLESCPHFLVRHIQVSLRLLDARASQHQLNDPDVDAVREQAAGAFVTQVVPSQVDLLELMPIPLRSLLSGLRFDAVREEPQSFPAGLDVRLVDALALPNKNASGPSAARRSRIAATRPFGLNGMRRFSVSFAVAPGMPIWQVSQFTRLF